MSLNKDILVAEFTISASTTKESTNRIRMEKLPLPKFGGNFRELCPTYLKLKKYFHYVNVAEEMLDCGLGHSKNHSISQ